MDLLRRAVERARAGEPLALATVVAVAGSAPRHPGAKMLVHADGSSFGTIGGGRVEEEVRRVAMEVAAGAPARLVTHHLVRDLAMCCGGSMELYLEPVAPSADALDQVLAALAGRGASLLVTPLDGGPKFVEPLPPGPSTRPRREGARFLEPVAPPERLFIFGCGHVARALGPLAASVGFQVVVCDDGETGALAEPVTGSHMHVASFDVRDVERELGALGRGDWIIVLTRDHGIDQRILEQLLPGDELSYLGVIGSAGKIGRFRKRILAKGLATEAQWARVHGPIGLDIGAETPAEIAVAVVAQLIEQQRRRG